MLRDQESVSPRTLAKPHSAGALVLWDHHDFIESQDVERIAHADVNGRSVVGLSIATFRHCVVIVATFEESEDLAKE